MNDLPREQTCENCQLRYDVAAECKNVGDDIDGNNDQFPWCMENHPPGDACVAGVNTGSCSFSDCDGCADFCGEESSACATMMGDAYCNCADGKKCRPSLVDLPVESPGTTSAFMFGVAGGASIVFAIVALNKRRGRISQETLLG
jgi:hypothetical protein